MPTDYVNTIEDAEAILDAYQDVTVDDLVRPYRDWLTSIAVRNGFGDMSPLVSWDAGNDESVQSRARELSAKLDRAADVIAAVTSSHFSPRNVDAAAAARTVFEAITGSVALRAWLMTDDEMLGTAQREVTAA